MKFNVIILMVLCLLITANGERGSYNCDGSACGCVHNCVNNFFEHATPMQKRLNIDWVANGCFMKCTGNPCKAECIFNGGNSHTCFHICNDRP